MIKTKVTTFDDIAGTIRDTDLDDLMGWFRLITTTYLTAKEKVMLEAQKAQIDSRVKQRELSVLYCVAQPHLSVNLRKLRNKIVTIYGFLRCEQLLTEYEESRGIFTPHQHRILSHVLAGYTSKTIAAIHGTTHVNACICVSLLCKRLMLARSKYPILCKYVKQYKRNFA